MVTLIALLAAAGFVLLVAARTIRIVPQARAGVIERFGRYQRTLSTHNCEASSTRQWASGASVSTE